MLGTHVEPVVVDAPQLGLGVGIAPFLDKLTVVDKPALELPPGVLLALYLLLQGLVLGLQLEAEAAEHGGREVDGRARLSPVPSQWFLTAGDHRVLALSILGLLVVPVADGVQDVLIQLQPELVRLHQQRVEGQSGLLQLREVGRARAFPDRKSTRLNSSHSQISY